MVDIHNTYAHIEEDGSAMNHFRASIFFGACIFRLGGMIFSAHFFPAVICIVTPGPSPISFQIFRCSLVAT
jgi:hypothetical protein